VSFVAGDQRQDVLHGRMAPERGSRRDTQHEPQAVGSQEPDAVDVVGESIRVLAHQPRGIGAICLTNAAGHGLAQANVPQPRVDVRDPGYRGERLTDSARAAGGDALDDTQFFWTVPEHLEDAVAKALDLRRGLRGYADPRLHLHPDCTGRLERPDRGPLVLMHVIAAAVIVRMLISQTDRKTP
jgi:hypothetical protein